MGTGLQAPSPFTPTNNLGQGYSLGLVPGMSQPTLAPQAGIYLQRLLETAQSPFTLHGIASGTSTLAEEIRNIQQNMQMWAAMNPDLAKGVDWQGPMNQAIQQYIAFVNGQPASAFRQDAPAVSLGTGQPLGYSFTNTTAQYDPSTDPHVMDAAKLEAPWFPTMQPNRPGLPGTGIQGPEGLPGTPLNFGMPGDPALTGSHTLAQNGFSAPTSGAPQTGNSQLDQLLMKLYLSGNQSTVMPSTVTTNPLGYTQFNNPSQGGGANGVDQATLLALLAGLLGNQGGRTQNYWQL